MRLVKPFEPTPGKKAGGGLRPHYPIRPQWLKDWIADKGQWVLLSCGHKDNMNDRATIVIRIFGTRNVEVFCERGKCYRFVSIVRLMKFKEYADIPNTAIPDEPLF